MPVITATFPATASATSGGTDRVSDAAGPTACAETPVATEVSATARRTAKGGAIRIGWGIGSGVEGARAPGAIGPPGALVENR